VRSQGVHLRDGEVVARREDIEIVLDDELKEVAEGEPQRSAGQIPREARPVANSGAADFIVDVARTMGGARNSAAMAMTTPRRRPRVTTGEALVNILR
jgi:hypothetical protein